MEEQPTPAAPRPPLQGGDNARLDKPAVALIPPPRRREVEALAELYLSRDAMPPAKINDAIHVAFATVHEMDILLSWNFKHLANVNKEARVSALNAEAGYRRGLRLTSPLEVEDEAE